jgi:hypothetical protein
MKHLNLILLSVLVLALVACEKVRGDGPVVTQNLEVSTFSGIDLRIDAEVYYHAAPDYSLQVSGQQNIIDVLETYTADGRLVIRYRGDVRVRSHERLHIQVAGPSVNTLRVSGPGNLYTSGPLSPSRMDIDMSGSGAISVSELACSFLDADLSGSGSIRVAGGTATEVSTHISGSGDIDLGGVAATKAKTFTSGSGTTHLQVSGSLESTISGSGNVFYRGNPTVESHTSGSGRVMKQ